MGSADRRWPGRLVTALPATHRLTEDRPILLSKRVHAAPAVLAAAVLLTSCAPSDVPSDVPNDAPRAAPVQGAESGASGASAVTLRYLGAAGWEISSVADGATDSLVVLVDPYLTRVNYSGTPSSDSTDTRPVYSRTDTLFSDTAVINREITRADYILVQHSHPDHVMDVPYIAHRTGAVVIGHESTINIMRAYGVPNEQLITVQGGEDYVFDDGIAVQVIPSLHSPLNDKRYFQSARIPRNVTRPMQISQLVEGGSLMFLVRIGGQQVLTMGSMNFIEREVDGLRPDIALVGAAPSHLEIRDYTPRLMAALGFPAVVIPTHADNFSVPYGAPNAYRTEWVDAFAAEVRDASPTSRVIIPKHLEPVVLSRP